MNKELADMLKNWTLVFSTTDKKARTDFVAVNPEWQNFWTARRRLHSPDGKTWNYYVKPEDDNAPARPKAVKRPGNGKARNRLITQMCVLLGVSGRVAPRGQLLTDNEWLMEVNRLALEILSLD